MEITLRDIVQTLFVDVICLLSTAKILYCPRIRFEVEVIKPVQHFYVFESTKKIGLI